MRGRGVCRTRPFEGEYRIGAPDRLTGQVAHTERIRHLSGRGEMAYQEDVQPDQVRSTNP